MSKDDLDKRRARIAAAGELLYGDRWPGRLSKALGRDPSYIHVMILKGQTLPKGLEEQLDQLLKHELVAMRDRLLTLENLHLDLKNDLDADEEAGR